VTVKDEQHQQTDTVDTMAETTRSFATGHFGATAQRIGLAALHNVCDWK
jgi:hypothetical protein